MESPLYTIVPDQVEKDWVNIKGNSKETEVVKDFIPKPLACTKKKDNATDRRKGRSREFKNLQFEVNYEKHLQRKGCLKTQ